MNEAAFNFINDFAGRSSVFDGVGIFLADGFSAIIVLAAVAFIIWKFPAGQRWRILALAIVSAVVARLGIVEPIRHIYFHPRPFAELEGVRQLMSYDGNVSSFPSGHAAFFFALATVIWFYNHKAGYVFLTLAFFNSLARVFVGIHWPLDILAGFVVGILVAAALSKIFVSRGFISEKIGN